MSKIVGALLGCKCLDEPADEFEERCHGAGRTLAQRHLQLRERLLYGIEIRRVGRQKRTVAPAASIASHTPDLMGAQIVHEEDVALAQCWCQHLLDIGEE